MRASDDSPILGPLRLGVASVERSRDFYRAALGLETREVPGGAELFLPSGDLLATLEERPGAVPESPAVPGLYHLALRVPHRPALARTFLRLKEARLPTDGPVDHGVSEAIYTEDPDETGIEIYRDRSRETWPTRGGHLAMGSRLAPPQDLLGALAEEMEGPGSTPEMTLGHLHLRVSNLKRSVDFYSSLLPLKVTQEDLPGAAFLAFGDYHHHLGLNVWSSQGGKPRDPQRSGLIELSFLFPVPSAFQSWKDRLLSQGCPELLSVAPNESWLLVRDPDGWDVRIRQAS